jgi:hypothetical protein
MDIERMKNASGKEILEMMREKITEAIESPEDSTISEIGETLREAMMCGAIVIASMTNQPLSAVFGAFAADAYLAELELQLQLDKRRAEQARNN